MKIALIGPQKSGKSTTAKALYDVAQSLTDDVLDVKARMSFADALRREVMGILIAQGIFPRNSDPSLLADPMYKSRYRPLLQAWGSLRRELNPNYWRDIVTTQIADAEGEWGGEHVFIVIDDCRYWNERDALKDMGFYFFRLEGQGAVIENPDHESERDWPHFPFDMFIPWATVDERVQMIRGYLLAGVTA